jgi:hypothetical protein
VKADSPRPLMHRTESIDYGVVIEGELTLVLDDSQVLLKPGSVVVQRAPTTRGRTALASRAACCSCWWMACTRRRSGRPCNSVDPKPRNLVR